MRTKGLRGAVCVVSCLVVFLVGAERKEEFYTKLEKICNKLDLKKEELKDTQAAICTCLVHNHRAKGKFLHTEEQEWILQIYSRPPQEVNAAIEAAIAAGDESKVETAHFTQQVFELCQKNPTYTVAQ